MFRSITRSIKISISHTVKQKSTREKSTNHKYPKNVRDLIDFSKVPNIDFAGKDKKYIDEEYVRGSGPGGQAVNTTSNAVQLRHTLTGVVVKCHESRSVDTNRKLAQQKLVDALDKFYNGVDSVDSQAQRIKSDLKKIDKADAKTRRDLKVLPKLREKEAKLLGKITWVTENPENYLDPETKIKELASALENIRSKIRDEEDKNSAIISPEFETNILSNKDESNKTP